MTTSPVNSPRTSTSSSPKAIAALDETVSRLHTLRTRRKRARQSVSLLKARYRSPLLNNKDDPLDELIFIILSQMTTSRSYERVFDRLKASMPDWRLLTETSVSDLTSIIADAGLSGQRTVRLKQIADRLVPRLWRGLPCGDHQLRRRDRAAVPDIASWGWGKNRQVRHDVQPRPTSSACGHPHSTCRRPFRTGADG